MAKKRQERVKANKSAPISKVKSAKVKNVKKVNRTPV
jgi:hypothetical protein